VTDVSYALRLLRLSPAFAAVAVLSLALGIGANTAIFSLIDTILLKKLPVREPGSLVFIDNSGGKSGGSSGPPYPCFELLRDSNTTLLGIAAFDETRFKVTIDGGMPEEIFGQYASGSYFDVLGIPAVRGRVLAPADDAIIGEGGRDGAVGVISHALWTRRFASNPNVIGTTIQVGRRVVTIVGITPPEFFGLQVGSPVDLTIPMTLSDTNLRSRTLWFFSIVARVKDGIAVEQSRAELHTLWDGYMNGIGEPREKRNYFSGIQLVPAGRGLGRRRRDLTEPLLIVMGIVGVVLLIGCANVANLLLARAAGRQNELAVRLAMGATRTRLVRQLLTEGAVLVACGTALGLLVARAGSSYLVARLTEGSDNGLLVVPFDLRLLGFTAGIGGLASLLFSVAPAISATRLGAAAPGARTATATPQIRTRLGSSLIVAQVTLSIVLLSSAALFLRTLENLHDLDPGFTAHNVLTMEVEASFPRSTIAKPTPADSRALHGQRAVEWAALLDRVIAMPRVQAAALATMTPLTGRDRGVSIAISGGAPLAGEDRGIHINTVTTNYFQALDLLLIAGRLFNEADRGGSLPVAILNQSAATKYFGSDNPIGRKVTFPGQPIPDEYEIVGVVKDIRYKSLREADERMAYLPLGHALDPIGSTVLIVRGGDDVAGLATPLREAAANAIPGGFATRIATLEERVERSLVRERLLSVLASFFGGLALVLAAIGLYGVMSYGVVRRTREIGIRMAVGAQRAAVLWMVLREMLVVVTIGVAIGSAAALAASRVVRNQLFGVAPGDTISIASAIGLLLTVGLIAGYLPARRATRVDPVVALRTE
jgi:putative ABC transport system permease protein